MVTRNAILSFLRALLIAISARGTESESWGKIILELIQMPRNHGNHGRFLKRRNQDQNDKTEKVFAYKRVISSHNNATSLNSSLGDRLQHI